MVPVSNLSLGDPETITVSENVTLIGITSPTTYVPSLLDDVTLVTVALLPLISILLLLLNDLTAPGVANVNKALLSKLSRIVPFSKLSASVPV